MSLRNKRKTELPQSVLRFQRQLPLLQVLKNLSKVVKRRRGFLSECPGECIHVLSDIAYNCLKGNLRFPPAKLKRLKRHRNSMLKLINAKGVNRGKRRLLVQEGGFLGSK